jgi:hypothetical protein
MSDLYVKGSEKVRFLDFSPLFASYLPFFERIMNAAFREEMRSRSAFKIFKIIAIAFAFRTRTQNACVRTRTRPSMPVRICLAFKKCNDEKKIIYIM